MDRSELGLAGEREAARLYEEAGLRVVDRNYRCRHGEIDIVAAADDVVVFCEVKTRATERWGDPSEAVAWAKQMRLRRLAGQWLRDRRWPPCDIRFDVMAVIVRTGRLEVRHIPDAF